jgi:hypothetical protein
MPPINSTNNASNNVIRTTATTATTAPTTTPSVDDGATALASTTTPAATFEGTSAAKKSAPFSPPSPPQLRNEKDAMSGQDLERIRDHNESLIKGYNKAYGAYLETYVEAVEAAPNLDRIRAFGPPVDYDPAASLPVAQRRNYDHLQKAKLANAMIVHEAIGERVLKETGHKVPGTYAFADLKATVFGNGVKGRLSLDEDGVHTKGSTQVGLNSKLLEPDLRIGGEKVGVGVTANIDFETGKVTKAVQVKAGAIALEADENGKVSMDSGLDFGEGDVKASAKMGSSYDGKNKRVEVYGKFGAKLGEAEIEAKYGVGVQLLTKEYVADALDRNDKGFFNDDDAKLRALRNSGR